MIQCLPHWDAFRCGKFDLNGLSLISPLIPVRGLENANLLYEMGFVESQMVTTAL